MQSNRKKGDASGCRSEFWGICCESKKRYSQVVGKKYHISMAALDPTDTMTSPCVSLMVERDGCQYLLCSLKPDSIPQVVLNLYFDKGENITFFLKGLGTVHLSGYYILDESDAPIVENSKKDLIHALTKKAGKKLETSFTVTENVETSDDEDSSDIEELEHDPTKGKTVSPAKKSAPATIISPKKNESQNMSSKKMFASSEEEESSDDDSEIESDEAEDSKKIKTYATKRVHSTIESEEESSDEEDDSDSLDLTEKLAKLKRQIPIKKFKADPSTPVQANKMGQKSPNKSAAFMKPGTDSKTLKPDMNSSIGRTPMPKKSVSFIQQTPANDSFSSKMQGQIKALVSPKDNSGDMDASVTKTPDKKSASTKPLDTSAQSESAKKKKNKKKKKANQSQVEDATSKSPSKPQFSNKLPSGVEYEDIRIGNGLMAKKGKLIHVYYTGKLENNKVFDSCQQGSKPFSFKLALGQVIKGWDLGIEGMKVGGKRKLKIPPNMGYGNQQMEVIPPNSTLYFVVELKAVS